MFVKNWKEVYKSLAVWLPFIATGILAALNHANDVQIIPVEYVPLVVVITSALGWVIKQPNIRK